MIGWLLHGPRAPRPISSEPFAVYAWDPDGDVGVGRFPTGKWRWTWSGSSSFVALWQFMLARVRTGRASLDWK